jgi:hemerythrin-like domain-containing protein
MAEPRGKRAEALQPLSREHLGALIAAKTLKDAHEEDVDAARRHFLEFWQDDGRRHFRVEEEVLLPWWARYARVDREGVDRMLEEHLTIRAEALRLQDREGGLAELHALGFLLHDHVRFEERELFPKIEVSLGPEHLAILVPVIAEAEHLEGG